MYDSLLQFLLAQALYPAPLAAILVLGAYIWVRLRYDRFPSLPTSLVAYYALSAMIVGLSKLFQAFIEPGKSQELALFGLISALIAIRAIWDIFENEVFGGQKTRRDCENTKSNFNESSRGLASEELTADQVVLDQVILEDLRGKPRKPPKKGKGAPDKSQNKTSPSKEAKSMKRLSAKKASRKRSAKKRKKRR